MDGVARMANTSIHRVNNASGGNATGSHWYTANYAAIQFGIGLYTDSNASPRAYIGWTSTPWIVSTNLTVSETQLTYKAKIYFMLAIIMTTLRRKRVVVLPVRGVSP